MRLLIDSSVWIDALSSRPTVAESFQKRLREEVVVKIRPIEAEVQAGAVSKAFADKISAGFAALESVDPDWNADDVWREMAEIARHSRRRHLSPLGVVDRMVLVAARRATSALWSLDRRAVANAAHLGIPCL